MTIHTGELAYDLVFIAIFAFCVVFATKRGAFRAVAGIVGTIAGLILGNMFQGRASPTIAGWLHPFAAKLIDGDSLPKLTERIQSLGLPEELRPLLESAQHAVGGAEDTARAALAEKLAQFLSDKVAPLIAFILIFLATKLAVSLICSVLSLDIPVISTLNHGLGALIGIVSGLLVLLVLCWGIWRFAPDLDIPVLSREALQRSMVGGFFCRLFT